jgi:hypothetical protein
MLRSVGCLGSLLMGPVMKCPAGRPGIERLRVGGEIRPF